MNPAVELLIHISAPSRGSDDARYRKQALGILEFEAVTRYPVLSRDEELQEGGASDGTTLGIEYTGVVPQTGEHLRREENDGAGEGIFLGLGAGNASQSPSRTEVQVISATAIPPIEAARASSTASATSPPSALSRLPPSSQSVHPLSSPVPRIHIPQTPFPTRPATAPTASSKTRTPKVIRRTQSDSWQTPPSVVPDSQPTLRSEKHIIPSSEKFSASSSSRNSHHWPPSAKRRRLASPREAASSTGSESQPPRPPSPQAPAHCVSNTPALSAASKRPPTNETFSTASASPPLPPSSQPPPLSSSPQDPPPQSIPIPLPPAPPTRSTIATHLTISTHKPPPPATALAPFTTHITPSLSIIADQLPLEKFFRPAHTARALRVLERGYWIVDLGAGGSDRRGDVDSGGKGRVATTGTTPAKEGTRPKSGREGQRADPTWQLRFWAYLTRFLADGRAGWAVWCERCIPTSAAPSPHSATGPDRHEGHEQTGSKREVVKVYCWGEIVGHIWLLLFLASERRVRGLGARWVDAGGEGVVCMV